MARLSSIASFVDGRQLDREAWEAYRTPIWDYIYNEVLVGDIREHDQLLCQNELSFFGDVLEHMSHVEGVKLLQTVQQAGRHYIASTPTYNTGQGDEYMGNKFEVHESAGEWSPSDFQSHVIVNGLLIGWN